ncbi:MAG: nucleoside monophosphate kinase [Firmicutes bacterium]|nr:nucleoside monophosphate kinase [Bacillota bacterium]
MKSIILIAAPAAGKGTEAVILKEQYNMPHISTGDLLRAAVAKGDERGNMINELITNGKFVSDDIVLELLKEKILEPACENGYILDGFPRNIAQAEAYDKILEEIKRDIGIVIVLDIDKEIAKSRISGRYSCPKCGKVYNINTNLKPINEGLCDICNIELTRRADDNPDTYEERYNTYLEKTEPLISYYDKKGIVYHVDSGISSEETHKQVVKILGE